MNLIEKYESVCSEIAEHVGYLGYFEDYIDTADFNYFWQACSDDKTIYWAKTKEDILEDTDQVYSNETKGIYRGEEFTLVAVRSDFSRDMYWLALNSKNEIK